MTTQLANDTIFFVFCIEYKNDQGTRFADDPPTFYFIAGAYTAGPPGLLVKPITAASEDTKLSEGFSCAELGPGATKQPRR
jgi:hypothetical protein